MTGESKGTGSVKLGKGVRFEYIHGHTIIYRSEQDKNYKWTKNIDDIVELLEGTLPEKEAAELCKKHIND